MRDAIPLDRLRSPHLRIRQKLRMMLAQLAFETNALASFVVLSPKTIMPSDFDYFVRNINHVADKPFA